MKILKEIIFCIGIFVLPTFTCHTSVDKGVLDAVTKIIRDPRNLYYRNMRSLIQLVRKNGGLIHVKLDHSDTTLLHLVAHYGWYKATCYLLARSADHGAADNDNETPLFGAVRSGNVEIVRLLLNFGAQVNVKSNTNVTPLFIAAGAGYLDIVELLVQYGADISVQTNEGFTPLSIAINRQKISVATFFICYKLAYSIPTERKQFYENAEIQTT